MKTVDSIKRFYTIVRLVRTRPYITSAALMRSISESNDFEMNGAYSKRTLQRDLKQLRELGYNIVYDSTKEGYHLDVLNYTINKEAEEFASDTYSILKTNMLLSLLGENKEIVDTTMEKSELLNPHFETIVGGLKHGKKLKITYYKIDLDVTKEYFVSPYFLREYNYRWYLIALDEEDNVQKSFAIERIAGVSFSHQSSNLIRREEARRKLVNVIGVSYFNEKPEHVEIVVTNKQYKYFINHPIHHSQVEGKSDGEVTLFKLFVVPNNELVMTLLQYGNTVRVLKPASLQIRINDTVKWMLKNRMLNRISLKETAKTFAPESFR